MSFQVEKYGKCIIVTFSVLKVDPSCLGLVSEKAEIVSPIYVVTAMNLEGREVSSRANHAWTCSACPARSLPPVSQEEGVTFCSFVCPEGMPF